MLYLLFGIFGSVGGLCLKFGNPRIGSVVETMVMVMEGGQKLLIA